MYGSDKVLLDIVTSLDKNLFNPIVVLPWQGPLMTHMQNAGIEVHTCRIARLSRGTLTLSGLIKLPFDIISSWKELDSLMAGRKAALAYSNTLAIISGALWSKWNNVPHLWHVHEMICKPLWVRSIYKFMLDYLADRAIFNSRASMSLFTEGRHRLYGKSQVIWNGIKGPDRDCGGQAAALRASLGIDKDATLVALVGRINRWKGQGLLVEAAGHLWNRGEKNIHFLMIGNTFQGCEHFRDELLELAASSDAAANIHIMDFQEDIWPVWKACDIAVVPSTEPEPFGLVATEAMAMAKPVIAAAHGGLLEIVKDEETGILFPPGDRLALADAISRLASDSRLAKRMGQAGQTRFQALFSVGAMVKNIEALFIDMICKTGGTTSETCNNQG
jgi:glycosyltransferase involved in cell wall biosynthesis